MLTRWQGLFEKIGPIVKLEMKYDRAGRSEGTAFVTYESHNDAKEAIQEYDGANAAGMLNRADVMLNNMVTIYRSADPDHTLAKRPKAQPFRYSRCSRPSSCRTYHGTWRTLEVALAPS